MFVTLSYGFSNKSKTLPVESQMNITTLALSPNGQLLIAVNEGIGQSLLIIVLHIC